MCERERRGMQESQRHYASSVVLQSISISNTELSFFALFRKSARNDNSVWEIKTILELVVADVSLRQDWLGLHEGYYLVVLSSKG